MVQLIVTDQIKDAASVALKDPSIPPLLRGVLEAAVAPPTSEEVAGESAYASYLAKIKHRETVLKNAEKERLASQGPWIPSKQVLELEAEEVDVVLPPNPRTLEHRTIKELSEVLLKNATEGAFHADDGSEWL